MESSLTIQFSNQAVQELQDTSWLNLEQELPPDILRAVNLYDITQMMTRASSGLSARSYIQDDCATDISENTLWLHFHFFVFPSDMNQGYSLTTSGNIITRAELVHVEKDFDVVFTMSNTVTMPFLFAGSVLWQGDVFNKFGERILPPHIDIVDNQLKVNDDVFGVVRVTGTALGYRHKLSVAVPIVDNAKITNLKPTVTASWTGSDGKTATTIMEVKVSDCMKSIIEECPNGETLVYGNVFDAADEEEPVPVIYYSTCTGRVIARRYE